MGLLGPSAKPEEVLVSEETGDDAAVYRLPDGGGLVVSVDVFTPIVDDPADWGAIAAANAFSDVYAMGGLPRLALNIAGWPVEEVPLALLADVLRGARDVAAEAGVAIVGGHTITTEKEPLFGLVAIGFVDPALLIRNATAAPGMTLVLTKPIGTGLIATAIKRDGATPEQAAAAVATMRALNAGAAAAATTAGVGAGTDVTGFGLLGHLHQMLQASDCEAVVDAAAVPTLPGVLALARADMVPDGTKRNLSWVRSKTVWGDLSEPERLVLADAQTSGGLLLATHEPEALVAALEDRGVSHAKIGRVVEGERGRIVVEGRLPG